MSPSVIRTVHNGENPFVQINKKALWDENLSMKAIGLWARCMSRPDNWRFNIKELAAKFKEGRRAIDAAIKELIEFGYAIRLEHWEKSEDGRFTNGGVEYVFFEFVATQQDKDSVLEEFKKSFRHCGFGNCRNGDSQNSNLPIKKKEQIKKSKESSSSSPPGGECLIPPPTKSEEEEILRRLKERKSKESIKSMKHWKAAVLQQLRQEATSLDTGVSTAELHKEEAKKYDLIKTSMGFTAYIGREGIELCHPCGQIINIKYNLPTDEWKQNINKYLQ